MVRTGLLVFIFFLGWVCTKLLISDDAATLSGASETASDNVRMVAKPELTPEEVVELQIDSLNKSLADPEAMKTCFGLASPSNRQATGPLERFATMVVSPPYDHLAYCEQWQVGAATIEGDFAVVLATTVDGENQVHAYRFFLVKQREPPYENCWLTEAVSALNFLESQKTPDTNSDSQTAFRSGEHRID
ncbi:MAG: hypothetical protein KDB03_12055 [Planctomycetales bacterium]|nr:hypothetical protein [Planctomycetales bacterium]